MLKWSVELCEHDIKLKPHTIIKAQALVNFLIEISFTEDELSIIPYEEPPYRQLPEHWTMLVNGSVNL